MKLNRTSVVLPLAALLVIGGAGAVFAANGSAPSGPTPVVPAADSPSPSAVTTAPVPDKPKDTVLEDTLDEARRRRHDHREPEEASSTASWPSAPPRQAARKAERDQLKAFLADGVITQAGDRPAPGRQPLRSLTTLLDDGKITTEELQTLGRGFGFGGGRGGHPFGKFFHGPGDKAAPAPSSSPTTGG